MALFLIKIIKRTKKKYYFLLNLKNINKFSRNSFIYFKKNYSEKF